MLQVLILMEEGWHGKRNWAYSIIFQFQCISITIHRRSLCIVNQAVFVYERLSTLRSTRHIVLNIWRQYTSLSLVALHALSLSLVDSTQCVPGYIWRFSLCCLATSHMHCIHIMHHWYCSHNKDVLYLVVVENKVNSAVWNWKLIVLRPCLVISRTHTCQEYFVHLSVPHILT